MSGEAKNQLLSSFVYMSFLFHSSNKPSIGVEIELQLLDPRTLDLCPVAEKILSACKLQGLSRIKCEIHKSMVEIDSEISQDVKECRRYLSDRLKKLSQIAKSFDIVLGITGTHPFQKWEERLISAGERYEWLHEKYRWLFRRMNVYGLHVHVGIRSGDRALAISKHLAPYLPHLLALSANSPFWHSVDTGMNSTRINIMDSFPFGGRPVSFETWEEFETYVKTLKKCNVIASLKDLYWHIRPNLDFGTLEFRICDGMSTLSETMSLVALIHCLVVWADENLASFKTIPKEFYWIEKENLWIAARDGLDGSILKSIQGNRIQISDDLQLLVKLLMPTAEKLNCKEELEHIFQMIQNGNGAKRQRATFEKTGSFKDVVAQSVYELDCSL